MKLNKVKKTVEFLMIQKNNFNIKHEDLELLYELEFLLELNNKIHLIPNNKECNCPIQKHNIQQEIELNKCFTCGLPLAVS